MTKSEKGLFFNALAQVLQNQINKELNGKLCDDDLSKSITLKNDLIITIGKLAEKPKKSAKKSIQERINEFTDEMVDINLSNYNKYNPIIGDFKRHWTELNKSKTRMRFEKEATFEMQKRMDRFLINKGKWDNERNKKRTGSAIITSDEARHAFNS